MGSLAYQAKDYGLNSLWGVSPAQTGKMPISQAGVGWVEQRETQNFEGLLGFAVTLPNLLLTKISGLNLRGFRQ